MNAVTASQVVLETPRLRLRTWHLRDIRPLAKMCADPQVMRYFPAPMSFQQTLKMLWRIRQHHRRYGYSLYATERKDTGALIGFVGLNAPAFRIPGFTPYAQPIIEIGWRLGVEHWGQGYAPEAAHAVLSHAFTTCGLEEIISFTSKLNKPSERVMQKIGLQHDPRDDFDHPNVQWTNPLHPHILYRLNKAQWEAAKE